MSLAAVFDYVLLDSGAEGSGEKAGGGFVERPSPIAAGDRREAVFAESALTQEKAVLLGFCAQMASIGLEPILLLGNGF